MQIDPVMSDVNRVEHVWTPAHNRGIAVTKMTLVSMIILMAALSLRAQTSIVAIRTTKELAVAADSYERAGTKPRVVCKISSRRNIYFAAARMVAMQSSNFSVFELAGKAV